MSKSSTIAGGAGEYERNESDFYTTPKEVTIALMKFLNLSRYTEILEPACGEGHITKALNDMGYEMVESRDLRNTGFGDCGFDYLKIKEPAWWGLIITNPPFNLAEEFIRKALGEGKIVAMLLKAHYWHAQGRYWLFHNRTPTYVLPLAWRPNMSPDRGSSATMDFQWTVWVKNEMCEMYGGYPPCQYIPLLKPEQKQPELFPVE